MKTTTLAVAAAAALLPLVSAQADASITVFTDRDAFEAAIAGQPVITDDFDQDIEAADSILLDSGIVSTNTGGQRGAFDNSVFGGVLENAVVASGDGASRTNTLAFPQAATGFGADFDVETGDSLVVNVEGSEGMMSFELADILATGQQFGLEGFFGIIADDPFAMITLTTTDDLFTFFTVDNLVLALPTDPIPVPGAAILFGTAIAGAAASRKRRRRGDA